MMSGITLRENWTAQHGDFKLVLHPKSNTVAKHLVGPTWTISSIALKPSQNLICRTLQLRRDISTLRTGYSLKCENRELQIQLPRDYGGRRYCIPTGMVEVAEVVDG